MGRHQHDPGNAAYDGAAAATRKPARPTTIFRGGHTREYTTLPNKTINDPRLGCEHVGALGRLLALPKDWQMHPWEIRKRWGVGRERYYSILKVLMEAGYIRRGEMIRGESGSFTAIEYLVFDEAQVVIDSEPPPDDNDDDGGQGDAPVPPPSRSTPPARSGVTSLPHTVLPHAGDPHAAEPFAEVSNNINNNPPTPHNPKPSPDNPENSPDRKAAVPLPNAAPTVAGQDSGPPIRGRGEHDASRRSLAHADAPGSEDGVVATVVEDFLDPWQRGGGDCMSRDRVDKLWFKLGHDDRRAAVDRLPQFFAERARKKWKLPDAGAYLRDRMWRGFSAKPAAPEAHFITAKDPEFTRWCEHLARWRGPFSMRWFVRSVKRNGGIMMPTRWPPGGEPPPQPLEELRAAVLLVNSADVDRVLIAQSAPEYEQWLRAAKRVGMTFGIGKHFDFDKPKDAPDREVVGTYFPARMPPEIPPGEWEG